ncbi:hypothetical protein PTT_00122, partial [Pyrenophora teres f. teres 0-1]
MALAAVFQHEKVQTAFFSPALLKHYLSSIPTVFRDLEAVYVTGDRFHSRDAIEVRALVPGSVYNLYGPSENALGSTIHELAVQETFANGVPIGRSISNSGAFVMDSQQRLVSLGVIGELVVTGDGLARGYTNPALDQDRFIHIIVNEKLVKAYRTGDRVRYRPIDGQLEFIGRIDYQAKIRGHRIEPGEVELTLLKNDSVRDAEVLVRKVDGQEAELVSFVTLRSDELTPMKCDEEGGKSLTENDVWQQECQRMEALLISALKRILPSYMIPARICVLENMPLNANGKVDRQALPKVVLQPVTRKTARIIVSPRNAIEQAVCEEFTHVLGHEIGIRDDFFELGGHSLLATRLVSSINRRLHLHCTVGDIFACPVVADLAGKIGCFLGTVEHTPIPRLETDGPVEQSFAQSLLWNVHQSHPTSTIFLLRLAIRLRGPLRLDALGSALLTLEERHDSLRTTFEQRDQVDLQIVHPFVRKPLRIANIAAGDPGEFMRSLLQEQETPFDLETEPGWRTKVFHLGEEDHVLSIVVHHMIYDGWSISIIQRELATFYTAAVRNQDPLAQVRPLTIQYRDFAVWQKQETQTAEHQRQLKYWKKQLGGSRPAELPYDKSRPTVRSGTVDVLPIDIPNQLYRELKQFCKTYQATSYNVLLAAFRVTHYRLTGVNDAIIGMLVANRNRQELEDIVGFYTNALGIRIHIKDVSFECLVQQVQQTTAAAAENQDVPIQTVLGELLPEARDIAAHNPFLRTIFALTPLKNLGQLQLDGIDTESLKLPLSQAMP